MATGNRKVSIYLKKFLTQQELTDNFLEYLLKQSRQNLATVYDEEGVFSGGVMSPSGADKFIISTPMTATDGNGHLMQLDPGRSLVQFENESGIDYYVGLRYNEFSVGTEVNVRTGELEYKLIEEQIGEKGEPNSVTDNGATITFVVDAVTEAGVNNAGRKVTVYLKRAVGQVDAFYEATVYWDGSNNKIDTVNLLGQTAGLVSVTPSDYTVFLHGPTVKRNTDLSADPNIVYLGIVTGAGAGNAPAVFDQSGVNPLFSNQGITQLADITRGFLAGGGLISWTLSTETLSIASDIYFKVPTRPYDFTLTADDFVLADGDVLYVMLDQVGGTKVLIQTTNGGVPENLFAVPIAMRIGNDVAFRNGALELKGDSTPTTGRIDDITKDILDFMGAVSESDSDPAYSSTTIVTQGVSLVAAISQLDAAMGAILGDTPQEEHFEVGIGGETNFVTSSINWSTDHTIPDLIVFMNGGKLRQSFTGALDQDFRKVSANEIEMSFTVPENALITIRRERSGGGIGGGGGGVLVTEDESVQVDASTIKYNFVGDGVTATQISPGVVQITVPGTGAGAVNVGKMVKNETGVTIPALSVLAWKDDGTVQLADANETDKSDFAGINIGAINDGEYGFAAKLGNVAGILSTLGAVPGDTVYIGETPGSVSLSAPVGLSDTIFKLGRAEPPQGVATPNAYDLWLEPEIIAEP